MNRRMMDILILGCVLAVSPARAATGADVKKLYEVSAASQPVSRPTRLADISIGTVTEEGRKLIRAVVLVGGKPVEDATVRFTVRRTFGELLLGEDKTLDDGSAAVPFPSDLPGGATGELQVVAEVKSPAEYGGRAEAVLPGASATTASAEEIPRALWSRRAPLPLVAAIIGLIGGVWTAYAYVAAQLLAIRRDARRGGVPPCDDARPVP
jgi:hypothetical protein